FQAPGTVRDMPVSGRPRATSGQKDRINVAKNRFSSVVRCVNLLWGGGARSVSLQTLHNRMHAAGFKSRVPAKKPCFQDQHIHARLAFCNEHAR
ncbi:LOW QUALITY PROTEIN: hypothetical protein MAR_005431, partial [Mya arenaria]